MWIWASGCKFTLFCHEATFVVHLRTFKCKIFRPQIVVASLLDKTSSSNLPLFRGSFKLYPKTFPKTHSLSRRFTGIWIFSYLLKYRRQARSRRANRIIWQNRVAARTGGERSLLCNRDWNFGGWVTCTRITALTYTVKRISEKQVSFQNLTN